MANAFLANLGHLISKFMMLSIFWESMVCLIVPTPLVVLFFTSVFTIG
jgi:hypothetical protein